MYFEVKDQKYTYNIVIYYNHSNYPKIVKFKVNNNDMIKYTLF